jgi:glycosyltransferase involved in cell wall biosynthesis
VKRLSVIIPSRTQPDQSLFLARALKSVQEQTARARVLIDAVIGLDPGAAPPDLPHSDLPVRCTNAAAPSQAAALNAAATLFDVDYLAFLEDDDRWLPAHLAVALECLEQAQFVSTTQLEVDAAGTIIRINDFPTPSGWVMPRSTWERVGAFDPRFRYHLDNEWLGRLGAAAVSRIHSTEATAPAQLTLAAQVRPWLANVVIHGGGQVRLARHNQALPNVVRLVHPGSGMAQIAHEPAKQQASLDEIARLQAKYGRLPW